MTVGSGDWLGLWELTPPINLLDRSAQLNVAERASLLDTGVPLIASIIGLLSLKFPAGVERCAHREPIDKQRLVSLQRLQSDYCDSKTSSSAMQPLHFDGRSEHRIQPQPRRGHRSPRLQIDLHSSCTSLRFAPNVTGEPCVWLARLVALHEA
jgi:hypothetical protein